MNLIPPPETEDIQELKRWCDELYEFLKHPVFQVMEVGDVESGNYTTFANDGELTQAGTPRVEKEVGIEAVSLAPGSTGPDATILGNYLGYRFDMIGLIGDYWMPRFIEATDPSAREIAKNDS